MKKQYRYFLLYKPYGYLSQFSDPVGGKKTLGDLFPFPKDVYPVGRLDEKSEGLLLLTNDTSVNQRLLGQGFEKEYWVQVEGIPDETAMQRLRDGVFIKVNKRNYQTSPCEVKLWENTPPVPDRSPPIRVRKFIPDAWISIVLREGKNRQVRKMGAAVGHPVLRLIRVRVHHWEIGEMLPGEVKELNKIKL